MTTTPKQWCWWQENRLASREVAYEKEIIGDGFILGFRFLEIVCVCKCFCPVFCFVSSCFSGFHQCES
jgi:hypothetical protein